MNTAAEIWIINRFKESFRSFPDGDLTKTNPPAPDFVLTRRAGETIGIELTEALHSEQARQVSNDTYNFTNLVLEELQNRLPFTFAIDIDLNPAKPIAKSKRGNAAKEVVKECVAEFSDLRPNEDKEIEHIEMDLSQVADDRPDILQMMHRRGLRNLPAGVQRIKIVRVDGIKQSWNWRGEGGVVPDFKIDDLLPILEKKHRSLKSYSFCDEFWLVITEGNYFTGSFNEILITTPIESFFDKVFLLRCAEKSVIELQ
jgi:hypothetical protein